MTPHPIHAKKEMKSLTDLNKKLFRFEFWEETHFNLTSGKVIELYVKNICTLSTYS